MSRQSLSCVLAVMLWIQVFTSGVILANTSGSLLKLFTPMAAYLQVSSFQQKNVVLRLLDMCKPVVLQIVERTAGVSPASAEVRLVSARGADVKLTVIRH